VVVTGQKQMRLLQGQPTQAVAVEVAMQLVVANQKMEALALSSFATQAHLLMLQV